MNINVLSIVVGLICSALRSFFSFSLPPKPNFWAQIKLTVYYKFIFRHEAMNLKKYNYFTDSTAEFHTNFKDSFCKDLNIDVASCAFYKYAWRKLQLFHLTPTLRLTVTILFIPASIFIFYDLPRWTSIITAIGPVSPLACTHVYYSLSSPAVLETQNTHTSQNQSCNVC